MKYSRDLRETQAGTILLEDKPATTEKRGFSLFRVIYLVFITIIGPILSSLLFPSYRHVLTQSRRCFLLLVSIMINWCLTVVIGVVYYFIVGQKFPPELVFFIIIGLLNCFCIELSYVVHNEQCKIDKYFLDYYAFRWGISKTLDHCKEEEMIMMENSYFKMDNMKIAFLSEPGKDRIQEIAEKIHDKFKIELKILKKWFKWISLLFHIAILFYWIGFYKTYRLVIQYNHSWNEAWTVIDPWFAVLIMATSTIIFSVILRFPSNYAYMERRLFFMESMSKLAANQCNSEDQVLDPCDPLSLQSWLALRNGLQGIGTCSERQQHWLTSSLSVFMIIEIIALLLFYFKLLNIAEVRLYLVFYIPLALISVAFFLNSLLSAAKLLEFTNKHIGLMTEKRKIFSKLIWFYNMTPEAKTYFDYKYLNKIVEELEERFRDQNGALEKQALVNFLRSLESTCDDICNELAHEKESHPYKFLTFPITYDLLRYLLFASIGALASIVWTAFEKVNRG